MRIRFGLPLLAILFLVPVASLVVHADVANSDVATVKVDAAKAFDDTLSNTDLSTDDASAVNLDDGASDLHRRWGWGRGWGRGWGWGGWGGYYGSYYPWYYNYYYPWSWWY